MNEGGQQQLLLAGALLVLALSVFLQIIQAWGRRLRSSAKFPRGPFAWPIVGHLPLLMRPRPHRVLADLSRKQAGYGPIVGLRLGAHQAVVVSSAAFAKELLFTHDKAFANRVPYVFADTLLYGYNTAVSFSSYNPRWVWMRKIYTLELLTPKRMHELGHVRQDEVRKLLHRLHEASSGGTRAVDVGACLADMSTNTIARLVHSKTLSEVAPELPELILAMEMDAFPTLGDFFPFLKFLDVFPKRRMKHLHDRLDKVFDSLVNERRRLMASCPTHELPNDFLQVILSLEASSAADEEKMTPREVKGIMLEIFTASIHTSTVTLEWAMAELLRNPECLQKLLEEVDQVTRDEKGIVIDDDVQKMPYLENVVKEVSRLHPIAPLLIPRMSSMDCEVGDYTLPKGTQAFVNVWAIARDPQTWDNPESFYPERFEGKDLDLRGQHYELLPFGSGRRMCPGLRLGLSVVQVTLANLVKFFDWQLPNGESTFTMDMMEKGTLGGSKEAPTLAIPKLRQSCPSCDLVQVM